MKEFKGTKKFYAVEFAGFYNIHDEPFYEGRNVLDYDPEEGVSEEEARANAQLIEAAPELLKSLQEILPHLGHYKDLHVSVQKKYLQAEKTISKALGQ